MPVAFEQALSCLKNTQGKIVLSGMGKSGIAARKVSATFCSLNIPALFLHPADASHGDLGVLSPSDTLILFSQSGNTAELMNVLKYSKALPVSCILITCHANSRLAKEASLTLEMPTVREACPFGLAPTTSVLMMIALGDALALSLSHMADFSATQYQQLHPKGQLGHQLQPLSDLMHRGDDLPLVPATSKMEDAVLEMTHKRFGCVGIVDDENRLIGIISDGDLRRHMAPDLLEKRVTDVMTSGPKTVQSDMLIREALELMNKKKITVLFVIDEAYRPHGLIHIHDCLALR